MNHVRNSSYCTHAAADVLSIVRSMKLDCMEQSIEKVCHVTIGSLEDDLHPVEGCHNVVPIESSQISEGCQSCVPLDPFFCAVTGKSPQ